jgi:predicted site-specific integrase-resolvase
MTTFLSQAAFAKRHGVARQTITRWARNGLVKLGADGRRVDVEASEKLLASRPSKYRGGKTRGPRTADDATAPIRR